MLFALVVVGVAAVVVVLVVVGVAAVVVVVEVVVFFLVGFLREVVVVLRVVEVVVSFCAVVYQKIYRHMNYRGGGLLKKK